MRGDAKLIRYERVPACATGSRRATLEIVLKPAAFDIEGLTYTGFSYQYRMRIADAKAHQLLDRTTWELGGCADGNTIVSQSQCCEPEHRCTRASSFRTWVANKRISGGRDELGLLPAAAPRRVYPDRRPGLRPGG
jgi:hypothetical protein